MPQSDKQKNASKRNWAKGRLISAKISIKNAIKYVPPEQRKLLEDCITGINLVTKYWDVGR